MYLRKEGLVVEETTDDTVDKCRVEQGGMVKDGTLHKITAKWLVRKK